MIEYLEIRDINREIIGIVDDAKSVIWHSTFFSVGDFEIYAQVTPEHLELLQAGRYVTRIDNDEIGIIEAIAIEDDIIDGAMITATGRFAKSILERRIIYKRTTEHSYSPALLKGNVENAVRAVVYANAINCSFDSKRNIGELVLGTQAETPFVFPAERQVSNENLLTYTDSVLQEFGLGSYILLDQERLSKKLKYEIIAGKNRSIDNTENNDVIIFSKEFDNLLSSKYAYDTNTEKNAILIGGEGEGNDRFYSAIIPNQTGLGRRETWLDSRSTSQTLKDSELLQAFPTGVFDGTTFKVGQTVYANLDLESSSFTREYSYETLIEKFPTGTKSDALFVVGGETYARLIYGETKKYNLTPLGYRALLTVDEAEGNYRLTDLQYDRMLIEQGSQTLAPLKALESFDGNIDITNGNYVYGRDFYIGDIVTVEEKSINKYVNVRIVEITEVQDNNGYKIEAKYE